MTEQEHACYALLKLMTPDTGKFAIPVGSELTPDQQFALEWMQSNRWITLIDVSPVAAAPLRLCRIFLASDQARSWFRKMG